jgi:large subunit ribosomal protein L35
LDGPTSRLPPPCAVAALGRSGAGEGPVERVCHNRPLAMPKMKTHSGAKKRFKVTATGKVRGRHAFTSHILEKKAPKRKRSLGAPAMISDHDTPRIKRMLGVGK